MADAVGMTQREGSLSTAFLKDAESQLLCLKDALQSGGGLAMLNAVQAVARVRGLDQLASDARVTPVELEALLGRSDAIDLTQLRKLTATLISSLAASREAASGVKMIRNRREDEKTG